MKLTNIVELAKVAGYNAEGKAAFKKEALWYLRLIATKLALNKRDYSIRFNAGGEAVSGDATLHHEKFYVTIGEQGVMWRECDGQKDYVGGGNNWLIGFGREGNEDEFFDRLRLITA